MKKLLLASLAFFFIPSLLSARPFLTREGPSLGFMTFEAGLAVTQRNDSFGSPEKKYETATIPFYARLGILNRLDLGFTIKYLDHRLSLGSSKLDGSVTSLVAPEAKWALTDNFSLLGIFTPTRAEQEADTLPMGRGNDFEMVACYSPATAWPLHFNLGEVWRGRYKSHFGVPTGPVATVEPGNIFEAKAALEIPLRSHFSILTETAYYYVDTMKISGNSLADSSGSACDALIGLDWGWKGWNVGVEAGFGLLSESHTSFEVERGSGDVQLIFYTSYRLAPWWMKK